MPGYVVNQELHEVAQQIIQTDRKNIAIVKIAYLFRAEAPVSDGKTIAGMCARLDDRNYTLHGYDFAIEISKDVWDQATDQFKKALMDHELGHIGIRCDEVGQPLIDENSGRLKTFCRKHDIEEFADVLERHGDYHPALRDFLSAHAASKAKKPTKKEPQTVEDNGQDVPM